MAIIIDFLSNVWFAPVFTILCIGLLKKYTPYVPSSNVDLLEDSTDGGVWIRTVDGRLQRL